MPRKLGIDLLRTTYGMRFFPETVHNLVYRGLVHTAMRLSLGQEAFAPGSVFALRNDHYILSAHRAHGHCTSNGPDLNRMMAELTNRKLGHIRDRYGSMRIAVTEVKRPGRDLIISAASIILHVQKKPQRLLREMVRRQRWCTPKP
ncbi:MAG TPA: thiamine pyrophosphate-dependent enzyme [Anaerolineae bacterium]|nr:thiamine pyrophosphate-dependent enzyme [Anaerolineae bacterium]